jgi:hypothetical protein
MIAVLKPWLSVAGELTKTLPGSWHGIRSANLAAQYNWTLEFTQSRSVIFFE